MSGLRALDQDAGGCAVGHHRREDCLAEVARFAVMADLLVATQFEACGSERLVALGRAALWPRRRLRRPAVRSGSV